MSIYLFRYLHNTYHRVHHHLGTTLGYVHSPGPLRGWIPRYKTLFERWWLIAQWWCLQGQTKIKCIQIPCLTELQTLRKKNMLRSFLFETKTKHTSVKVEIGSVCGITCNWNLSLHKNSSTSSLSWVLLNPATNFTPPPQILLVKKKQVHIRYTIYLSTRTVRTIPVSEILGSCPVPHLSKLEPNDAPPNSRPARQVDSKNSYAKRRKTSWKGSMAIRHLPLVLVYHGPLEIATFWELRHLLSLGCNIFEIFIMLYVPKKLSCQTFNHFNCTRGTFLGENLQEFSMSHGSSG